MAKNKDSLGALYDALESARSENARAKAAYVDALNERMPYLGTGWKWMYAGPELVVARCGDMHLSLRRDGAMLIQGAGDTTHLSAHLMKVARAALDELSRIDPEVSQ